MSFFFLRGIKYELNLVQKASLVYSIKEKISWIIQFFVNFPTIILTLFIMNNIFYGLSLEYSNMIKPKLSEVIWQNNSKLVNKQKFVLF